MTNLSVLRDESRPLLRGPQLQLFRFPFGEWTEIRGISLSADKRARTHKTQNETTAEQRTAGGSQRRKAPQEQAGQRRRSRRSGQAHAE